MNELEKRLKEALSEKDIELQDKMLTAISEEYNSAADHEIIMKFMDTEFEHIMQDMDKVEQKIDETAIKQQLNDVIEILPLSYIAKNYFHKSASWLYQRINGYEVRGKVYELKPHEIETLRTAIQEISRKFTTVSLSL